MPASPSKQSNVASQPCFDYGAGAQRKKLVVGVPRTELQVEKPG